MKNKIDKIREVNDVKYNVNKDVHFLRNKLENLL